MPISQSNYLSRSIVGYTGSAGPSSPANSSTVYLNSAATTLGTGWQKVPIDTVSSDIAGWWDNTNKNFKVTIEGWYIVNGRARVNIANIGTLGIGKNGVQVVGTGSDTGGAQSAIGGSFMIYLTATDTVDLRIFCSTAGISYTTGVFDTYLQITGPVQAGGAPGSNGQVTYNNSSAFGGAAQFYYDDTNNRVGVGTATPSTIFHVVGDSTFDGAIDEKVHTLSGTSVALDPSNGTIQVHTLTGTTTYTDSLIAGESITLMIDDGTAFTVTWPTITWVNNAGAAPTLATTGFTVIAIWKVGTTLYGALVGNGT